jgi:ribonucleoside-triphosphate reductase
MNVIKRDGSKVEFDINRIKRAIMLAFEACDYDVDDETIENIASDVPVWDNIHIEDIQDQVIEVLRDWDFNDVADEYTLYRQERAIARANKDRLTRETMGKLSASNIENQNANVDEHSFGGRKGEAANILTKEYALEYCVSSLSRENHVNNRIYIHDLDAYILGEHNCLTIPFDDLLANGFNTRQTDVRPANSVNTAFQLVAVIFQLQSLQQFGGVSASHIDWTMVPYVKKSFRKHVRAWYRFVEGYSKEEAEAKTQELEAKYGELCFNNEAIKNDLPNIYKFAYGQTETETYQAVEGMYHNLNTLQSRSGNQLPFTSINYGTCTEPEGRLVTKAILDVSIAGLGKQHRTPIFPCGIFQIMSGVNKAPGEPNYDLKRLALKSTSQRLYPNYANVDWSGNAGYDRNDPRTYFSTMGCRTVNGFDINGFGQLKDGRGNIAPVTIILPTIAMEAKEKCIAETNGMYTEEMLLKYFFTYLDEKIHEAKDMLIERFNFIASQDPKSAKFMYENKTMAGYIPEEGIISALKHGTLTIGQLGVAECLQILVGCDHTEEHGMEVAKRIEQLYKDRCAEFKQTYKLNFGVYYTPAENLCYTAMQKFKAKYGVIPNVSDREYFTNSMHVPVWKNMTPFEKIDIEAQLTGYSSAGCITYVELPVATKYNIDALEKIVDYAMDKDIPYFAVNVPNDQCQDCGYVDEMNDTCPVCGSRRIKRLRRVTGYLTGDYKEAFNYGKQCETEERVKHIKEF